MLAQLYKKVDECSFCKSAGNTLQHIHGYGAMNPEFMLVLINPTYRNISSHPEYKGIRFPFIGVRQFWNILGDSGFIDKMELPVWTGWKQVHTQMIQDELNERKLFLTNIVKCCYPHGNYPSKEVIDAQKSILAEEIRIVKPKHIIAFGALTFKTLTDKNIAMSVYWNSRERNIFEEVISGNKIPVTPCYFPVGRGSPKKSAQALRKML